MGFKIIRDDIINMKVDGIVCPSNPNLREGSGSSYAIYKAAGEKNLKRACEKIGKCDYTKAVASSGFSLCKTIIHVVGPIYEIGSEEDLKKTYESSLQCALENHCTSVAIPLLSSGSYGFPKSISLHIAISTISSFLMKSELDVYLVIYDQETVNLAKKIMPIEERIDEEYTKENDEDYAYRGFEKDFERRNQRNCYNRCQADCIVLEECKTISSISASNNRETIRHNSSLKVLLSQKHETFSDMLLRIIDEKGLKDSEVYKKANITKQHFNKIKNIKGYTPKKPTIFSLAIVLELSLEDTIELLSKAGQSFSDCSKTDIIVKYYITNGIYNLNELNEMLYSYHLEPLCL